MTRIKSDLKTCHKDFSLCQCKMLTKAQELEDLMDFVLYDLLNNMFCDFDFKHRCFKQKIEMGIHIARYVHKYDVSAICPLQFLSTIRHFFQRYILHSTLTSCTLLHHSTRRMWWSRWLESESHRWEIGAMEMSIYWNWCLVPSFSNLLQLQVSIVVFTFLVWHLIDSASAIEKTISSGQTQQVSLYIVWRFYVNMILIY